MEIAEQDFRTMLVGLSSRVTAYELDMMKFYSRQHVPVARLEDVTEAVHLWIALEEVGVLSWDDTSYLKDLLEKAVKRHDLLKTVVAYEQQCRHQTQAVAASSVDQGIRPLLEYVAQNINVQKWRGLVRTLGLVDADIDNITVQYRDSVRDQILRALLLWMTKFGAQANRNALIDGLQKSYLKLTADQLKEKFPI